MIQANRSGEWLSAEELKGELLAWPDDKSNPVVDLAGVDYLDASCLQIVLAFHDEAERKGHALEFRNISAALASWIDYAGAADYFGTQASEQLR